MKAKNVFKRMGALALAAAMIAGTWTVSAQPAKAAVKDNYQVEKVSYDKNYTLDDGTTYFSVKAKFPQIKGDSASAKKINQALAKEKKEIVSQWDKDSKTYKKDYADTLKHAKKDGNEIGWTYGDSIACQIKANNDKYFSVVLTGYLFTGGAHGQPYRKCLTFNAQTGEKLTAAKLFGISKVKLNQKVKNLYLKKCDKAGKNAADYFYASDDVRATLQKNLKSVDFNNAFYVKNNGKAVFYADPYAVAPYAAGFVEVSTAIK